MKQSSKRLFSLLSSVFLVFAAFYIYFSLIQPAYADINESRATIYGKEQLIKTEKAIVDKVKAIVSNYEGKSAVRDSVALAIPSQSDQATAVSQVTGLAQMNQLGVQSITASIPSVETLKKAESPKRTGNFDVRPVGVFSMQVKLVGTYSNFRNFMRSIENNIRIMDIKNISVEELGKPNQDLYLFTVTVVTYYQNP